MTVSVPRVLGISAFYHDASAALVEDGEVTAAAAEERFTRLKHDANFPRHAIDDCLRRRGLTPQDLDAVVFYEEPHVKFTRILASLLGGFPRSRSSFVGAMQSWLGDKLWTRNAISRHLDLHPDVVVCVPHHESHAAQAFYTSPYADAAVLTVDAVGEWACTSIAHGTGGGERGLELVETTQYPHSLGLVYAAFTAFLGFRPNDSEASTMALAAFGEPRYLDEMRRIVQFDEEGRYRVDHRLFDFLGDDRGLFTAELLERFGPPRDNRQDLPFDSLGEVGGAPVSADAQRYADVAASLQRLLEESMVALAQRARRLTGSRHLCLAGGVALNPVANSRVMEEAGFDEVFVPPDPGDGGAATGAALLVYHRRYGDQRRPRVSPYLGGSYDADSLVSLLEEADPEDWSGYLLEGCEATDASQLRFERLGDVDQLVEEVAAALDRGAIVGWFQDRFELGPRALGNRSILADPANLETVRRLSEKVKLRASYRPYALSVREEDAAELLGFATTPPCGRWMQMVAPVSPELLPRVRGGVHVDGTTRPQVCSRDENPRYHRLLDAFARLRGLGALLNTSFNEAGYPMVATPYEALLVFARTDMDLLVVDDLVVERRRAAATVTEPLQTAAAGGPS